MYLPLPLVCDTLRTRHAVSLLIPNPYSLFPIPYSLKKAPRFCGELFFLFLKAVDNSLEAALLAVAKIEDTVNAFLGEKSAGKAAEGTKGHILD